MLQAKDIMTKEVVVVWPETSVKETLKLMLANEVSGIPVVERDMKLVGIVTEKDLLRLFVEPGNIGKKKVKEFMTQPVVHFDENENIEDICQCLNTVHFRRVPVTKDDKLVGIVSRPDIIRYILSIEHQEINI
jgi:CBS domain-containing protein